MVMKNSKDARAWYKKGSLYALHGDKDKALKHLAKTIELNATFKNLAITAKDFKSLWDDKDFQKLVK